MIIIIVNNTNNNNNSNNNNNNNNNNNRIMLGGGALPPLHPLLAAWNLLAGGKNWKSKKWKIENEKMKELWIINNDYYYCQ